MSQLKITGIALLIGCLVALFVAWERNSSNANNVAAMNQFTRSSPLGNVFGTGELKPAMPASSKYALIIAAMLGIGGGVCLAKSSDQRRRGNDAH